MKYYTDHPITELGDKEFVEAPVRECEINRYDGNKYLYLTVEGIKKEIKRGYVYSAQGRYGEVDCVSNSEIQLALESK
jgi:hypothetical protein